MEETSLVVTLYFLSAIPIAFYWICPKNGMSMAENLDTQENAMAIDNGALYLRGILANGNSVRVDNIMKTISRISQTVDCNEMKDEGRFAAYTWMNAPYSGIAILEVLWYSWDWIVQKIYYMEAASPVYVRSWYNGNTWSEWRKI